MSINHSLFYQPLSLLTLPFFLMFLKKKTIQILARALMMGPLVSFDANFGMIYDTLNAIVRPRFLAIGQLYKRKYQMDMKTVGLKFDFSVRCQFVFMFRTPFKQLYYHE